MLNRNCWNRIRHWMLVVGVMIGLLGLESASSCHEGCGDDSASCFDDSAAIA